MGKRRKPDGPLLRRAAFLSVVLALLILTACGQDDDPSGAGFTGDMGTACNVECYGQWCKDDDQISCSSAFCIGPPEDTYCTAACEVDAQCPEGFGCTEECGTEVAKYPVCVREEDFALLRELGYCPESS